MTIVIFSKSFRFALFVLALGAPVLAVAGDGAVRLNDSRALPFQSLTYNSEVIGVAPNTTTRHVTDVELDDFLICNEFATSGNTANTNVRIRPRHGDWVIGSWDYSVPVDGGYQYYLQGSFSRVSKLDYDRGMFSIRACDANGNGEGCNPAQHEPALQCYTASSDGTGVSDTGRLFGTGFDNCEAADGSCARSDNSSIAIEITQWPASANADLEYTIYYQLPAGYQKPAQTLSGTSWYPTDDYVVQRGYDQSVFKSCAMDAGGNLVTAQVGQLHGTCKMHDYQQQPDPSRPVLVAALFTGPFTSAEPDYSDNVAFARLALPVDGARLDVQVFNGGSVTAQPSPTPLRGDIYQCSSADAGQANCNATYPLGATVQLSANAGAGHTFGAWGGACVALPGSAMQASVTLAGDKTCTAFFNPQNYTLTYQAGAHGALDGDAVQTVPHGGSGSLVTAFPLDTGWEFLKWSDGVMTAARQDTNVTGSFTVTAMFQKESYLVTATAGANGHVNPSSQSIPYQGTAFVQVYPDGGFQIDAVTGDTCSPAYDGPITGTTGSQYRISSVEAPCAVHASFIPDTGPQTFTVTPLVTAGQGSTSPSTPQQVEQGDTAFFQLVPAAGANWEVDAVEGTCEGSLDGNNGFTTAPVQGNCTVEVKFRNTGFGGS